MSDQPKPTGEWRACEHCKQFEKSVKILDSNSYSVGEARNWDSAINIANAHNAELAAERERHGEVIKKFGGVEAVALWDEKLEEIEQLRSQLAAAHSVIMQQQAAIVQHNESGYVRQGFCKVINLEED